MNLDIRSSRSSLTWVKLVCRFVALLLSVVQLILLRNSTGPDARSYSEIARAYLRHDWTMAINSYWSPLYSWLIALVLRVGKPSLRQEYPLIQLLNFFLFIISLMAFEFFWNGLQDSIRFKKLKSVGDVFWPLPTSVQWILGYSLFIWLTVGIIVGVGPDLCVASTVLFVAGLLVRIQTLDASSGGRSLYVWLGVTLGLGYLAKAVMFPMAFIFLGVLTCLRFERKNITNAAFALLVFAVIALPQIAVLSIAKQRITFSDTGKLTFAWSNYGFPICSWPDQPPCNGMTHPIRMIYDHPKLFEFNGPIRSSYPPWYDPSYWNAGWSPKFRIALIFRHFASNGVGILQYFTRPRIWLAALILLLLVSDLRATVRGVSQYWYLIVPCVCVFGAYSLTFAEFRYMPGWLLLVWASVIAGLRLRPKVVSGVIVKSVAASVAIVVAVAMAHGLYVQLQSKAKPLRDVTPQYAVAEGLSTLGLRPGDRVGSIGFDNDAHWAYMDGLMIVAEIPTGSACYFWNSPADDYANVLKKFAEAGATAIVANRAREFHSTSADEPFDFASCSHPGSGWHRVGNTEDYVFFLINRSPRSVVPGL